MAIVEGEMTVSVTTERRVRVRKVAWATFAALLFSLPIASLINTKLRVPTDYDAELGRIDQELSGLKEAASSTASDAEKAVRLALRLYNRAALTGGAAEFIGAEGALKHAVQQIGPAPELALLQANIDFRLHRVADAARGLEALSRSGGGAQIEALRAGILFQEGRYEEARKGYLSAIAKSPTWDNLARLAYWESKFGDPDVADRLYGQAQEEISAKEMRSYAWVELQRGLLDLRRGRRDEALAHYRRAGKAYSGYWLVDEHMAELLGAQRKFSEAIALYESVIARAPRPELQQALGDLYVVMGDASRARPWHDKAMAGYLESVGHGEVHYYHHLGGFYADVRQDGPEAVKWGRKDVELRPNFFTQEGLAWAHYRNGELAQALAVTDAALSSGVKDAHLFFHAGMIYLAAGRSDGGKELLQRAAAINPRFEDFHVHR
jgi:tetratricopeptide (TPR) repeat protein